jgi:hypothetical protein
MTSQQTPEKVKQFPVVARDSDGSPEMTVKEQLLAMQWAQLKHDELYHKEITLLSVAGRIKHFALHMAKYLGYFADALDSGDKDRFERTLIDVFIITLASANTLNLSLGEALACQEAAAPSLKALGVELSRQFQFRTDDNIWFLKQFARDCGRLAKACESLDHVESHPFRETMLASILDLFKLTVIESSLIHVDLVERAKKRLRGVEAKSIFDSHYKAGQSVE